MMDGQEIVNIRNQLLPVVRLHEIFNIESDTTELWEGILVIVENEGQSVCLFLDEVIGQQQVVIKGLSEYVGDVHSASGCTIMGDGTISLILDIKAIIDKAENTIIGNNPKLKLVTQSNQDKNKNTNRQEIEEIVSA
jgi:two-component system chemotaxis sensor kinase CheA